MRITISKENYLKAIAEAESEGEAVKAVTLRHWLGVSAPAVTMAVKRLKRDGLIEVQGEGQIELTAAGREITSRLLNRHHLIERMLTEIFGLEWYKVHEEAEQLEHAVSADFERKLSEKLGPDALCPHGNMAATDSPGQRRARGLLPLPETSVGDSVRVACVFERDRAFLERLDGLGIRPGVWLLVVDAGEEMLRVDAGAGGVALELPAAGRIWVARA